MAGVNKVFFIGRLTKDPELRYTKDEKAVTDFGLAVDNPKREAKARLASRNMPDLLVEVLDTDERVFDKVLREPMQGRPGAIALQAIITTYKPGSKTARFMMAGAGKAKLQMVVRIVETDTGKEVISFPIKRTWAWGGGMGASKGIEDMDENVATELAMYLEKCKHGQ